MSSGSKFYKFFSFIAVGITIAVSSMYYEDSKPNAYEIRVFDKVVAYVKADKDVFNEINSIGTEVESRFKTSELKNNIAVFSSRVTEDYLIDNKLVEKAIIQNSGMKVEALSMLCDGKEIAIVANEAEGKQALDKVKEYYASKSGIAVKDSKIKNKITYSAKKVSLSEVDTIEQVKNRIIDVNSKLKKPILTIETTGTEITKKTISPKTVTKTSNSLPSGQSKVESEGKNGEKTIVIQVLAQNGKITSSWVESEKITTPAKDKVIIKGTKTNSKTISTATSAILATPSRGTISSNFGMRWGRMHEGLDIAAGMGTPIYAALDGTVTYSGWATGYGNFIKLKHKDGLETYYGHCSKLLVKEGDTVKKGQEIGKVGSTGNSTGPHLHFEVRVNGVAKDPTPYLGSIQSK